MIEVTDKPKELLTKLRKLCEDATPHKRAEWRKALRRIRGEQEDDISQIDITDSTHSGEQPPEQLLNILNLCYRNFVSFEARTIPQLRNVQVIAASREARDLRAAYSVGRMLRNELLGHRGRYVDELLRMISFVFCCHTSFCLVEGVKKVGEDFGEVQLYSGPPFDFLWYPHVRQWWRSPVVITTERRTKDEIMERWGVDDKTIAVIEKAMKQNGGAVYPEEIGTETNQPGASETVYEINRVFIKPGRDYKKGAQRILLGESLILDVKDKDGKGGHTIGTSDGKYPIVVVNDVPLGYYDYGYSRMEQIADPQRAYNEFRSKYVQALKELAVVNIMLPSQSGIKRDDLINRAVAIMDYTGFGGQKPEISGMPDMGAVVGGMQLMRSEIDDVHNQNPMSRGQPQGTRMPVGTTQALLQRAEGQDYVLISQLKDAVSEVGERIIIEGRKVWPKSKVFNVVGAHRRFEAIEFETADLKDNFSVRVQPDDGLPKTKEERWTKVTEAMKAQMMTPAHARKLLEVLDEEDEYSTQQVHEQRAYQDFLALKEAVAPVEVTPFDNHIVHIAAEARHAVEEMSATGNPLDPEFHKALVKHRDAHLVAQQQANAETAAMQAPPPPPAPPPGGGMDQTPEGAAVAPMEGMS